MATCETETIEEGLTLEELPEVPEAWEQVDQDELGYAVRDAWVNTESGLRLEVKYQRRPTQMQNPDTSEDDTGYIATVYGDEPEQITPHLSSKTFAYRRAHELMLNFPEGDFEPEFRDIEWEGPRSVDEWA